MDIERKQVFMSTIDLIYIYMYHAILGVKMFELLFFEIEPNCYTPGFLANAIDNLFASKVTVI